MLSSQEVRLGLDEPLQQIIDAIKSTLDKTPPELSSDIMDRGIVLAGGGALLNRLDERLRRETEMPVHVAESPLTCVAVGSGRALEEFDVLQRSSRPGRTTTAAATDGGVHTDWGLARPCRREHGRRVALARGLYSTPNVRNASATDMPWARAARTVFSLADFCSASPTISAASAAGSTTTPSWSPSTKSPGLHLDAAALDRHACGLDADAAEGVGAVDAARERREVHVDQREGVAHVGVGHDAARAAQP